jgi:soluble lytic murein transglycosylase
MFWVTPLVHIVFISLFSVGLQARTPSKESSSCGQALKLAGKDQFAKARKALNPRQYPLETDLVAWLYLKSDVTTASFQDYVNFLRKHQGWPWEALLKKRAELRMDESVSQVQILSWFRENPPQTLKGLIRYVQALESTGRKEEARQKVHTFWVQTDLTQHDEKKILKELGKYIRSVDTKKRATHLLNEGKIETAERLLKYLSSSDKLMIEVRLSLQKKEDRASSLLQEAKLNPLQDVHLAKDYLTWLRKREDPRLFAYFQKISSLSQKYPEKFWKERYILAHEALEAGKLDRSYRLASQHGLLSGMDYVDAEWFCGWVALRFLKEPRRALSHFKKLESIVKTPISRSRISYWLGRTYDVMKKPKEARAFYQKAAQYKGTFYGQQAFYKLGHSREEIVVEFLHFTPAQRSKFESQKAVKLIRLLAKAGLEEHILSFSYVFAKQTFSSVERQQILALTHEVAPHYEVEIAQVIAHHQSTLYSEAFPRLKSAYLKYMAKVDIALAHAVIRKESKFNSSSVSGAGARGLMQLMPETAKLIADQCGVMCSEKQLVTDPLLNIKLGSLYLKEQLEKYDYSFPLTLASYNAGPGTVSRWLTRFPDPRQPSIDMIDWIEILPYSETRNYIHRVLENYTVYKAILPRSS